MDAGRKRHTDSAYEAELLRVRQNLLRMAGYVEEMITDSVRALLTRNRTLAERTIEADHRVNRFEVETDELCLLILAKRQPVASDLRLITLSMKMVTDLERIGDLAVNIGERALGLEALSPAPASPTLPTMADRVKAMVRDAIDAFVDQDVAKAEDVCSRDARVDELYLDLFNEVQSLMKDPESIERGMHWQAAGKFLERIGDHATNLAEMVIFMVKGKDIRHLGKL
jgi:phosphate transport system protein